MPHHGVVTVKKPERYCAIQQIAFTEYDIEKSERGAREFKALNGPRYTFGADRW